MRRTSIFISLGVCFIFVSLAWANADFKPSNSPYSTEETSPTSQPVTPIAENPDVEAQVSGQYPELYRQESLPLGAIQHAWDHAGKEAGVYQINYNPREVIRLITREFMTTTVAFPVWENIIKVELGDKTAYRVTTPTPNLVIISPNEFVGIDSSITMIGESGHVYAFYVRSEGYNSDNISDIVVQIRVPAPKFELKNRNSLLTTALQEKTDYLEAVTFDPAHLDFDFNMKGDKSIAPERVFSDGMRTWFDYGSSMGSITLPAIYVVLDGVDTPINVTREKTRLVAQATGKFALKSGQKTTCVYPASLEPKRTFDKSTE